MKCDIVIPIYDQVDYVRQCVDSIFAHTQVAFRLLLVDDASPSKEIAPFLKELAYRYPCQIEVITQKKNTGYVGAVNTGLARTTAGHVCVMNSDTLVTEGWLKEMIAIAGKSPRIGLVNPSWEVPRRQENRIDAYAKARAVSLRGTCIGTDWIRGFCWLVKREVLEAIGGLDEDFAPAYYDDWDYSIRAIRAGFSCVQAQGAFVFHYRNVSYSALANGLDTDSLLNQKALIFHKRWGYPVRLLVLLDNKMAITNKEVYEMMEKMLIQQHRLKVLSGPSSKVPRYTNCRPFCVNSALFAVTVLMILLDEARHSEKKRSRIILCSSVWAHRLCRWKYIRKQYRIQSLGQPEDISEVFDSLAILKRG